MKDLRHLSEITTRYGTRNINELEFSTPEDFKKYKAKHKMRPGTVVKVAGKDKVIGDEPKPKAPKKTTGTDTKKPASKDDIEKNIMSDKPKLDPKVKQRAQDNYNDAINNIKNPQMAGGIETYYVDMAADSLEKLGNPDAKVFKDLGKEFRDNLDDDGNPKNEKLDKQIQDKIKLAALDLETDITKDVGTEIKDGKIKSSGPQQFTDDVKNIKGEYDLGGGVKIKDGKMFDADGEEMDDDDIDDFYYQDAYDEDGNNVGIDIKDEPKKAKRKSVQLDFTQAKNQAELERMVKKAGLDVKDVDVDINPNGDLTAKVTGDEETLRKFMTSDEYGMDAEDVDDYMDEYGEDAEDDESETESKPYSARNEIDDAIDQDESEAAMELIQSEVGFKNMGKDGKEAKKLLDRLADAEYALIDLDDEEKDEIKDRLKQITKKHIKESKISKLRELSKITTRYNK